MKIRTMKMNEEFNKESDLYPSVIAWFKSLLKERNKRSSVQVFDTSRVSLWKFLKDNEYCKYFQDYITFEIQVDITAIVLRKKSASLSFIECKLNPISLKDISQLLGYSRVALPLYSIIISPKGISSSVSYLLKTFNRYDVLKYDSDKRIRIAKWDSSKNEVDIRSILPPGEYL